MGKLIKLELKKYSLKNNIIAVFICNICILGLLSLLYYVEEDSSFIQTYNGLFEILGSLVYLTFIMFSGFLISKFIIEEYKNKTILILFSYPISRKKIIISKLIIIGIFICSSMLLSYVFVFASFYTIQVITHTTFGEMTVEMLSTQFIKVVIASVVNAIISLIPLYFGLKKKSVPITILSSFIVASILYSNNNGFSLASIIIIPLIFGMIGIFTIYYSIKDIDKKDLLSS